MTVTYRTRKKWARDSAGSTLEGNQRILALIDYIDDLEEIIWKFEFLHSQICKCAEKGSAEAGCYCAHYRDYQYGGYTGVEHYDCCGWRESRAPLLQEIVERFE